jgi:hypothetical protein
LRHVVRPLAAREYTQLSLMSTKSREGEKGEKTERKKREVYGDTGF